MKYIVVINLDLDFMETIEEEVSEEKMELIKKISKLIPGYKEFVTKVLDDEVDNETTIQYFRSMGVETSELGLFVNEWDDELLNLYDDFCIFLSIFDISYYPKNEMINLYHWK